MSRRKPVVILRYSEGSGTEQHGIQMLRGYAQHDNLPRPYRRGFTLIEMLTTVAVLVIVLGLMVSLARDVRNRSAERLTKDLLRRLDLLVAQYKQRNLKSLSPDEQKAYPVVHPLLGQDPIDIGDEAKQREN